MLPEDKITMAANGNVIADFINEIQLYNSGAMVSAVSLANEITGFRQSVTRRDIIATYPYPNTLVVFKMKGKDLKAAIERSAEYFKKTQDGKLNVSKEFLEPKVEHYNYDYFKGIDYEIDPTKPIGSRVVKFQYQGKDISDDENLTVCVNNYRASGAGHYPMYPQSKVEKEINTEMVELIMAYFEQQKGTTIKVQQSKKIIK